MQADIIQHHEALDFESLLGNNNSLYLGLDLHGFSNFLNTVGEKHSFMGLAEGNDRVRTAFENAIASDEAAEIISRASFVMSIVIYSPKTKRRITIKEMGCLNDIISEVPEDCDVVWAMVDDSSLGDMVKVFVLINAKD